MKKRLEEFKKMNDEFKKHCYELSKKYFQYEKDLYEKPYYYYDLSGMDINKLDFEYNYECGEMSIGYEEYYCGDTDRYYNIFEDEELIDENLIKEKIDNRYKKILEEKRKKEEDEKKKKEEAEKREYETYKKLKEKYEN
jgi:hypothetical protein